VDNLIKWRSRELSLVIDSWTNIRNESIINYTLVSRSKAIFIKLVHIEVNQHTGQYITDRLLQVIKKIGLDKLSMVTTNNASNITSLWD
jgi:hypothetical protein